MSGRQIGAVIGGVIGAYFGGPVGAQFGAAIGGAIGGAIDPEVIRAPSIGDAQQQTAQAGAPRPVVYGHPAPFGGNIIDGESKARKIIVEEEQGKGGGPIVESERFLLTTAIRICEGPIAGIVRIWRNGEVVYDRRTIEDMPAYSGGGVGDFLAYVAAARAKSASFQNKVRIYLGDEDQLPDPALEAIHGVGNTPYYRGTAYIVIEDDDVTDTRGAAAQYQFEVLAVGTEAAIGTVVPNVSPAPSAGAGRSGDDPTAYVDLAIAGAPMSAPVMQIVASNSSMAVHAGRPRAPLAGLSDAGRYGVGKVQVLNSIGAILFDSGWMGDPVQQADLNRALAAYGLPSAPVVSSPQTATLVLPAGSSGLRFRNFVLTFGATFIETADGAGIVTLYYPDPAYLPDTVTTTPEFPGALLGSDGGLYYPAWVTPPDMSTITPGSISLRSVVEDIAERCGVPAAKIDATELTDIIPGLLIAQQFTGADCLRPTQQMYFYDLPEIDGPIVAVKRGGAIVATITDDDLLEIGADDEAVRPQQVEYPAKVSVVTQDPAAEYSAIPQTSIRTSPNVKATSEISIQSPIPLSANAAKRVAEISHKVAFAQAEGRRDFALPEEYSRLVPSDTFMHNGKRWLIEQKDSSDGDNRFKVVYDRASAYLSTATGAETRPPALPSTGLRGPTLLAWMNLPILRDVDDKIGFYLAATGIFDGWNGCVVLGSIDDGVTVDQLATITTRSVIGRLTTALPAASATVIDTANTVRVTVQGTLESVTAGQLMNEFNACLIGDELCQFQTATMISEGVYDLSILTRGRLDSAAAAHAIGTRFVLLGSHTFVEVPAVWIGKQIQLRAVTNGTLAENNDPINVLWSPAKIQTEWAPVQFVGTRDTSNNVAIRWVGRGRLGTNAAPYHSSFFDGYRVSVTKGGVTVAKPLQPANSYTYTAAEQTADFGSATGTLTISITAINRITGASAALTGTVL